MDEQLNNFENSIEQLSQEELAIRNASRQMYIEEGHPEPERKMVSLWDVITMFGLEVILRVASTLGAAIVSASAVGQIMEIMVSKLNETFNANVNATGTGSMFYWSILAFEVGLMASGMTKGRKNTEVKDSNWTIAAGLSVTITAGLMRSLTLLNIPGVELFISVIFGLAIAGAGPLISLYGAENFGYILKEIQRLQEEFDKTWTERLREFSEGFRKEYPRIAKQVYGKDRRLRAKFDDDEATPKKQERQNGNLRNDVRNWLLAQAIRPKQVGDLKDGALVTPAHIADALELQDPRDRNAVRTYMAQFRKEEEAGKWV